MSANIVTFISSSYSLFLPVVYLIFFVIPDLWRWLLLLLASYGFYASLQAQYLLAVLFVVSAISYICGLRIAAHSDDATRTLVRFIPCAAQYQFTTNDYRDIFHVTPIAGRDFSKHLASSLR